MLLNRTYAISSKRDFEFDFESVNSGLEISLWTYVFQRSKELKQETVTNFHELRHVVTSDVISLALLYY